MNTEKLKRVVAFLRDAFPNDGAEGESVHLVCDEVERLSQLVNTRHGGAMADIHTIHARPRLRLVRSSEEMMADLQAAIDSISERAPKPRQQDMAEALQRIKIVELPEMKPGAVMPLNQHYVPVRDGEPFEALAMHPETAQALRAACAPRMADVIRLDDWR